MSPHTIRAEEFSEHQGWLLNFVRRLVKDDFTADDIVQDAFEQALKTDPQQAVKRSWLAVVAHNKILERRRKEARRRKREEFVSRMPEIILNNSNDVGDMTALAATCLNALPQAQKEVLMLRYMAELEPSEIAAQTGFTLDEVYRLTERGKRATQNQFGEKYGDDWRSHCAGILGISLVSTAAPLLKTLAIAAALLVTAAGIWIGVDALTRDKNFGLLEADAITASLPAAEVDGLQPVMELPVAATRFPLAPVTPAMNNFHGAVVQIVDEQGTPVEYQPLIASWDTPYGLVSGKSNFETDGNGLAYVILPEEVTDFAIAAHCESFLNPWVEATATSPAPTVVVTVQKGSWTQDLRAVDRNNRPLEGILLSSFQAGAPTGYFRTDENGIAAATFPSRGTYTISMVDSNAYPGQSIVLDSVSASPLLDILCAPLPAKAVLRAVDEHGATLQVAEFLANRTTRDEFDVPVRRFQELLPSSAGVVSLLANDRTPFIPMITVSPPGFQPVVALIATNTDPELAVICFPISNHPARIKLHDPERTVVSAEIQQTVRIVRWPIRPMDAHEVASTVVSYALEVQPDGSFNIPQADSDIEGPFELTVTDNLGHVQVLGQLQLEKLDKDTNGVALIPLPPVPTTLVNLSLSHADGTPIADATVVVSIRRVGASQEDLRTDQNGKIQFLSTPGVGLSLSLSYDSFRLSGNITIPVHGNSLELNIQLPACESVISGGVLLNNDMPAKFDHIGSTYLTPVMCQTGNGLSFPLKLTVKPEVQVGAFQLEGVPSGQYETELGFYNGPTIMESHSSDSVAELRIPTFDQLLVRASDSNSNPLASAVVFRPQSSSPGFHLDWLSNSDSSGLAQFALMNPAINAELVLAVDSFEPCVLSDLLTDRANSFILQDGRSIEDLDMLALGITLEEEKYWIVDLWGDYTDPRQGLVNEIHATNRIIIRSAPAGGFNLVEIDANGVPTGQRILVPVGAAPQRNDL